MFFGDEEPTEAPVEDEVLEMQPAPEEFKAAIMEQLKAQMGSELEDPEKASSGSRASFNRC